MCWLLVKSVVPNDTKGGHPPRQRLGHPAWLQRLERFSCPELDLVMVSHQRMDGIGRVPLRGVNPEARLP